MLRSQGSFNDLEAMLKTFQDVDDINTGKAIQGHRRKSLPSDKAVQRENAKFQDVPIVKIQRCDQMGFQDLLMEILLHQQLHTAKEYTVSGLSFIVYILDDTDL